MQSRSLAFLFIVIIAIPLIALSSNHEIFFTVMSLVITIISVRYIFRFFSGESLHDAETNEELEEELEELIDMDVKRFGTGLSVACNLLVILFMFYCAFYLDTIVLKAIASFAIILQVYFIKKKTGKDAAIFDPDRYKPQIALSSVLNIAVILFTVLNKLYKLQ